MGRSSDGSCPFTAVLEPTDGQPTSTSYLNSLPPRATEAQRQPLPAGEGAIATGPPAFGGSADGRRCRDRYARPPASGR